MDRLRSVLHTNAALMHALALCRDLLPVTAFIGAGAIRNTVWDHLHDRQPGLAGDIDVVFFDAVIDPDADAGFRRALAAARPGFAWDVTNQAHVHAWYHDYFGEPVAPLQSLAQALGTWPDTATAVAVRMDQDGKLEVIAPFGLDDLFDLALRWNPARVSHDDFAARIRDKRWRERWPRLRLIEPAPGIAPPGNR